MAPAPSLIRILQPVLYAAVVAVGLSSGAAPVLAQAQAAERELTVDEFSVVKLTVKAVPDARSARRTASPSMPGSMRSRMTRSQLL